MSEDIVGLAHVMIDAVREGGCTATGWWVSPKAAVQIADYFGIDITIPEDLTSLLGLPVEVDPIANGIALLSERPGIRVAHNNQISDTHQRSLTDRSVDGDYPFCDTCDNAYYPCATRILLDLIAELKDCPEFPVAAAARAEARLREVTGDE